MAKVSVIVPVYNSSKKLPRCLESLICQTLSDIEIILVNDASTDDSYEIMLKYEKQASDRIIVINCDTNSRAGGARNIGLDIASGQYIGFVDSDDIVKEDMFECLYDKCVEGDYDIVDSPLYITGSDSIRDPIDDCFCDRNLSGGEKELLILSDGYIVTKLFRSALLNSNNIRFRPYVKLEDADFLLKAVLHAEKFGNIHDSKYVYDTISDTDTWSVRGTTASEYEHILLLMEEYGRILKNDPAAGQCQTAVKAAILHFYQSGIACCLPQSGDGRSGELSSEDLARLIRIKDVKNSIFRNGYDNPYFVRRSNEHMISLMRQIDDLSM